MSNLWRYLNYLRLIAFPLGYGLTGVLVSGTLNRVMIADLNLAAALVAVFLAVPQLISPLRIWFGYRSDGHPLLGRRREPYIVIGALITGVGLLTAVLLITSSTSALVLVGVLLAFVIYGLGRNLAHNSFEALLADKFTKEQRSRAMTLYEVATLLGAVIGGGALGRAMEDYDPTRLTAIVLGVLVTVVMLSTFAAVQQELITSQTPALAQKARQRPFTQVVREVVLNDPQVRLFFVIVLFTFIGTLAQDILLEPYGALVLGMRAGETTRLTVYWGLGVMGSMVLAGLVLVNRFGYRNILRLGLVVSMLVFIGIIAVATANTAILSNRSIFNGLTFIMGLGTGLAGAGMLTGIVTFTTPTRAGLLMGVWGMANMLGRAIGTIIGGVALSLTKWLAGGNDFVAYATVFTLEVILLAVAFLLTFQLDPARSQAHLEEQQALSGTS
jgi:BCD family chlorophyll transporter-like MFS transporter